MTVRSYAGLSGIYDQLHFVVRFMATYIASIGAVMSSGSVSTAATIGSGQHFKLDNSIQLGFGDRRFAHTALNSCAVNDCGMHLPRY